MDDFGLKEDQFPVRSREVSGSVGTVPTDVTLLDFADKILLTVTQEGRLSQWVSIPHLVLQLLNPGNFARIALRINLRW